MPGAVTSKAEVTNISKHGFWVLVDDRAVTAIPSFEDLYQFGSTFLDSGFPLYIKIAHVVNTISLSDHEFLETVAVNRGANVKTFQNIDTALEWLTS